MVVALVVHLLQACIIFSSVNVTMDFSGHIIIQETK